MKKSTNKITVFFGRYSASAMDTDAARMTDNLANHMFCRCHFIFLKTMMIIRSELAGESRIHFPTNWPFRNIIRPFIRCNRSRGLTKSEIKAKYEWTPFIKYKCDCNVIWWDQIDVYLGSNPQTEPERRPPGPDSRVHFFQVDMVFCRRSNIIIIL